jgi:hypothetical protein
VDLISERTPKESLILSLNLKPALSKGTIESKNANGNR